MTQPRRPTDPVLPAQPRWHQRLGVRFGVVLAATLMVFDLLRQLLYDLTLRILGSPMFSTVAVALLSGAIAILLAVLLAFAISRWLTGRLARFSREAAESMRRDDLPGPFDASGEDEISIMATSMNAMRARVEERLKAFALQNIRQREWFAQVSHDLRTPLTAQLACLGRADSVLQEPDTPQRREKLRELLTVAKLDGDRVQTLADDLLEIARLDAGDRLRLEPVPPGELVRQAVRGLEPLAEQRQMKIRVKITSRLPVLNADGRRLMRAIENLLRNAIQHARTSVEVIATLSSKNVRFEVRDDGRGLPKEPDFLAYLRRRSGDVRLTELAKRRGRADSAGLGLVVVQRVAEAHRGVVDAYNLSNGGAAFWMDIPVPSESTSPSEAEDAAVG